MEYDASRATWWGSFRVGQGHVISTGSSCHDDFEYGGPTARQVAVGAEAGCVSTRYDFNYVSLAHGGDVAERRHQQPAPLRRGSLPPRGRTWP